MKVNSVWNFLQRKDRFNSYGKIMYILIIFPFLFSANCKANRNYTEYKPKSIAGHPSFPGKIILPQDYFSYRHYTENEKLIFGIERASKYGSVPAEKKLWEYPSANLVKKKLSGLSGMIFKWVLNLKRLCTGLNL